MNIQWNKCVGEVWCKLDAVKLDHSHFDNMEGVYVIWHGGVKAATVRVGQGIIRDRLKAHRTNPKTQEFASLGLFATWARVAPEQRNGVESYLAKVLKPIVSDRLPDEGIIPASTQEIPVDLPWK